MTPLKLVVLIILFYIGYRLLVGIVKKKADKTQTEERSASQVAEKLVEDPVCHTLVPQGQALRLQHEDEIYYFCSEACCNRFLSDKGEKK